MFKKECKDTAKNLSLALILCMIVIIILFSILYISGNLNKTPIIDVLYLATEVFFILIAVFLGSGIFAEEKKQGTFEYLFSLKYSRNQLLRNKLIPRFIAFSILFSIYLIMFFLKSELFFLKPLLFLSLFFTVFIFFTSLSLLQKNNTLNTIYNLIVFTLILGAIFLISYFFSNMLRSGFDYKIILLSLHIFTLLSIILFIIFVLSFKTIDLANLNFEFMRKNLIKFAIVFGSFLFIFIGINQLDSSKDPGEFSEKDLLPARFETNNGFYRFLTLFEPEDVDIESEKTINKYRFLFDPQFDKKTNSHRWDLLSFKKMSSPYSKIWHQYFKSEHSNWLKLHKKPLNQSWSSIIFSEKLSIQKLVNKLDILLNRYQKLVDSPSFIDFTTPGKEMSLWTHSLWLRYISKIYVSKLIHDCLEGNWNQGIAALLKHLNFTKEIIKGSRSIITNSMAKFSMQITLIAIADLMNRDDCPKEIYKQVYDSMPDLQYEYYGSKNALIADYLSFVDYMQNGVRKKLNNDLSYFLYRLFLQENRTRKYVNKWTAKFIDLERKQPFMSQNNEKKLYDEYKNINGFLWWLHNPSGKILIDEHWYPRIYLSGRSYMVKALYDMTKISAQLRLNYKSEPIPVTLKNLQSYKTLVDPFSGKSYKYNVKKMVIYSVGTDLVDNNGIQKFQYGKDIVLPLFLETRIE